MQEIEMKSRVRGRVLLPGEVGYDAERNGRNPDRRAPSGDDRGGGRREDVVAAVRYAASASLPVAVQATGHGPSVPRTRAVLITPGA